MRYVILLIFLVWAVWASFSTGGLYELKQINPEYNHPDKNVAFLVSSLYTSDSSRFWDSFHVEQCSFYMPNWSKAKSCVTQRMVCELRAPEKVIYSYKAGDIFSEEFRSCWSKKRPSTGPFEWLRYSRALWRIGITSGIYFLTGMPFRTGESVNKFREEYAGFVQMIENWVEKAE